MVQHTTGLGKGLDALIRNNAAPPTGSGIELVPLAQISPNPNQPRKKFDEQALNELAASIKSQGLLQPLLVRPAGPDKPGEYEIVAGERRWRACKIAGLREVPVMIRAFSAQDTLVAALVENLQREDLNPMEESLGLQTLKEDYGLSQEELARKVGKSRPAIANSLRLLSLPMEAQKCVSEGLISAGHARALLSIGKADAQLELLRMIMERGLSVREAEGQAVIWKETGEFSLRGDDQTNEPEAEQGVSPEDTATEKPAPVGKRPQSAILLQAQTAIGELFQLPVKVTGKEEKGKISFSYSSREELEGLLRRLTSAALEGASHPVLIGASNPTLTNESHQPLTHTVHATLVNTAHQELEGNDHQPLSGQDHKEVAGHNRQAIEGAGNQALAGADNQALPHYVVASIEPSTPETRGSAPDDNDETRGEG